ncbi:MAG: molybdopterin molybdotransferase MoeA [Planctomycetota bacterium]
MPETGEMILLSDALKIVEERLVGITLPVENIPVHQALGKTVVENQIARLDLPPFNKSAMDGYAVLASDEREEYRIIETVPAGSTPGKQLTPGTATKVMTGAPVPQGTGKVIMLEQTCEKDGRIRVLSHSHTTNICCKGEDLRRGDIIIHAPAVLGPLEIANLVSAGITEVKVARRIQVSIISTGDELADSPEQLAMGKIMNSNSPMLNALCEKYGLQVISNSMVPDKLNKTVSALAEGLNSADIVILSGGVSVGDFDFVTEAMKQAGLQLHFNRLAVKPGKPMTFASSERKIAFGLPGNPVAVYLMFHLFVLYAAKLMTGLKPKVRYVMLPLARDFSCRQAERMAFLPCQLAQNGMLEPIEYHGTAHLRALLDSDGFFIVPKGVNNLPAGEKVSYLSIKGNFE